MAKDVPRLRSKSYFQPGRNAGGQRLGRRYALKNLPGDFSGLQLISIMHVGLLLIDPNSDPGTGLDREYEVAMAMRGKK